MWAGASFVAPEGDGVRILSLDGGDAGSMSQLIILEELMHRLEVDLMRPVRPCEYFHLITGVGAAGVLAILLGVLSLSVTDARDAFAAICLSVLGADESTAAMKSERLEESVEGLLTRLHIPEDTRLEGDLNTVLGCHVSICYASAVNMGTCRMFRSYKSGHSSYNPTIVEAIRASWATPGLFSSIHLGAELMREEIISAVNGFNNPIMEVIKEAKEIFGKDRRVSCLLSLGAGQSPIRSVSSTNYVKKTAEDTETVAREVQRALGRLGIYFRFSVDYGAEPEGSIKEDTLGIVAAHTAVYLESDNKSQRLNRFLTISGNTGNTTLDALSRAHARMTRVSHGLPPLSAFLVAREEPMNAIIAALQKAEHYGQRRAVVTGLSGCGKTQISLKYAYDHDNEYDHILFVDASSNESIQAGIVTRVRALDYQLNPKTPKEALHLLAYPRGNISKNWLIIMDNADNNRFDIRDFFPPAPEHGAILITSRNPALANISSVGHVPLDVMSLDEAVEALLSAALGPIVADAGTIKDAKNGSAPVTSRSEKDRQVAIEIVEALGFLPIAIIQAAFYIKMQKCLYDYRSRLMKSRGKLLRWPASVQSDQLKYSHSTYAAFDTTISVLSARTLQILGILSFFHFTNFPRSLVTLAASLGFNYDPHDLLDRTSEYQESIALLKAVFCPDGDWDEFEFDQVLEELQQYSLVTLVPIYSIVTLRFHPLLHAWSRDRLSEKERSSLGAAAVRLLVCGTHPDEQHLWNYLSPHVNLLSLTSEDLHVNDRAALVAILRAEGGHADTVATVWQNIHAIVEKTHGKTHIRTVQAGLHLADAYGQQGDDPRMEAMERELLEVSRSTVGEDCLETAKIMSNLARTCKARAEALPEAATLEEHALRIYREVLGPQHRDIVDALRELATTRSAQEDYVEVKRLLEEALIMITSLVGRAHVMTIYVMESLAVCHASAGNAAESVELRRDAMNLWRAVRGDRHAATLNAMAGLATTYQQQAQYAEAEKVWREVLQGRQDILGPGHEDSLTALSSLARSIYQQNRYSTAEELWEEEVKGRRALHGEDHDATLEAIYWTARSIFEQGRYTEAEALWREEVEGRFKLHGEEHGETQSALFWLSRSVQAQSRFEDAEVLWRRHLAARRKMDGTSDTLNALGWLAVVLRELKQYPESEVLRREELKGRLELNGLLNNDTLNSQFSLARVLFEQEKYVEAEALWKEELVARRELHGEYHTDTLDAMLWIARSIHAQERYAEAEVVWKELLAAQMHMDLASDILNTKGWLAFSLREQKKNTESESVRREELDGRRESLGRLDNTTMNALFSLARVVYDQERYEEAEGLWREELGCRREVHGDRHTDTLDAIHWLGRSLFEQGKFEEALTFWTEEAEGRPEVDGKDHSDTARATEWLEKVKEKLGKSSGINGPAPAPEDEESGKAIEASSTHRAHAQTEAEDAPQHEPQSGPSSPAVPSPPQQRRHPPPWFQRFQQSGRKRLSRISHILP